MFKFIALAGVFVGILQGATITGGTISVSQPGQQGNTTYMYSLTLSDGVNAIGGQGFDGNQFSPCLDVNGVPCTFSGPSILGAGGPKQIDISLLPTYSQSFTPVSGVPVQSFQTAFTLYGNVSYGFLGSVCPFPEITGGDSCALSVTGYGTATITLSQAFFSGNREVFFISGAVFTFAPEPSSAWLLSAALPFALLCWRRASRNQLRPVAVADCTLARK